MATDMRANQVQNPRVYIDYLQYFHLKGVGGTSNDLDLKNPFSGYARIGNRAGSSQWSVIGLKPNRGGLYSLTDTQSPFNNYWIYDFPIDLEDMFNFDDSETISTGNCWFGLFGHDLYSARQSDYQSGSNFNKVDLIRKSNNQHLYFTEIANIGNENNIKPEANGWSLAKVKSIDALSDSDYKGSIKVRFIKADYDNDTHIRLGAMGFGSIYDFPVSPDLNVNFSRTYDGIQSKRSQYNGSTITNVSYEGCPDWGVTDAWEITRETSPYGISRNGRRAWDIKFSYINGEDVYSDNELVNYAIDKDNDGIITDSDLFLNTMPNTSDWSGLRGVWSTLWEAKNESTLDMYKMFIHKTMGGKLPFIFQPDTTNNNADGFAICTILQDSISFEQVAFNAYSVSFKIEESW